MGFKHVESGPLVRSSYHAQEQAEATGLAPAPGMAASLTVAVPSEVRRVQAAIDNNNRKELEWSLWYARMRQSVAARAAGGREVLVRGGGSSWTQILHPPAAEELLSDAHERSRRTAGSGASPLPGCEAPPEDCRRTKQ